MRTGLAISLVILVLVTAGGVMEQRMMGATAARYVSAAEELRVLIEDGHWQRAAETAEAYRARWDEEFERLAMVMDHAQGKRVKEAMGYMMVGIECRSGELCRIGLMQLREAAEDLYERDALTWGNVM